MSEIDRRAGIPAHDLEAAMFVVATGRLVLLDVIAAAGVVFERIRARVAAGGGRAS